MLARVQSQPRHIPIQNLSRLTSVTSRLVASDLQRRSRHIHCAKPRRRCIHVAGRLDSLIALQEERTKQRLEEGTLLGKLKRIDKFGDAVLPEFGDVGKEK
jgi:hypothetical protein